MEIQKTLNSQSNLEKEKWNRRNQPAWLQTILQNHSHQDSMVSHTFYCSYKPLPPDWAFVVIWSFPFLFPFFLSSSFFPLKPIIFFLCVFLCFPFLLFFPPCSRSLMYINLLPLPLFNFAYLFLLSFLSFLSSQHIC